MSNYHFSDFGQRNAKMIKKQRNNGEEKKCFKDFEKLY